MQQAKTQINTADSHLIAMVRFVMIAALVIHHVFENPNSGFFPRDSLTTNTLTIANLINALLHWSSMAAVPALSIVSGFLFFASPSTIAHKLKKRLATVALPSVIWSCAWFIVAAGLYIIGHKKGLFEWANYGFDQITPLLLLNGILGVTKEPFAFQFWFIHDLILTLALTPAIYWLLQKTGLIFVLCVATAWLANAIPFPFFSGNVLTFFTVGAYLNLKSVNLTEQLNKLHKIAPLLFLLFLASLLGRAFHNLHSVLGGHAYLCVLRVLGVICAGISIAWLLQKAPKIAQYIRGLATYSFFIFAAHYPIIEFVKIITQRIPGQSYQTGQIISLLGIPTTTIFICIVAAMLLQKMAPKLFSILNGGRGS